MQTRNAPAHQHQTFVRDLLNARVPVRFAAGGPSMAPILRDGDRVEVHPCSPADLRRGAIVLVQAHGRLILHRLVSIDHQQNRCRLAGDAAVRGAEEFAAQGILGVAEWRLRGTERRPLNTAWARFAGRMRFLLRPVRRWAVELRRDLRAR